MVPTDQPGARNGVPYEERARQFRELRSRTPTKVGTSLVEGAGDLELGPSDKEVRTRFTNLYKQLVPAKTEDHHLVHFTRRGIKKVRRHSGDLDIMRVIPALRDLVERATFLFSEPDIQPKEHPNILEWRHYAAPAEINGRKMYVRLTTWKNVEAGERLSFYDIHLTLGQLIEKGPEGLPSVLAKHRVASSDLFHDRLYQHFEDLIKGSSYVT